MNEGTFLQQLDSVVTGHGVKVWKPLPIREAHLASDSTTLTTTTSTNPGFAVVETNLSVLTWAAAKTVEAGYTLQIPDDYDESVDECVVMLKAAMSDSTNTPALVTDAFVDSAATTDLNPDATDALSATKAWVEIDLSGNGFVAGDVVQLQIAPEAHATDAVYVYAMKLRYASDIVAYNKDSR